MAQIHGIDGMTHGELAEAIERGGRFVQFSYTVSVLIMTFKRGTDIHFIPAHESPMGKGLGPTLITLVFGWWGFPWGPIYSVGSLYTNLTGGKDLTSAVTDQIGLYEPESILPQTRAS